MVPTAFMGATLPLLAQPRGAARRRDRSARRRALRAQHRGRGRGHARHRVRAAARARPAATIWLAVAVNALVFGFAAGRARGARPPSAASARRATRSARAGCCPLLAISGWVSFSYEVLWTRLLSHLLGGSIYAFAMMLASFLLGITLGSAAAARFASDARRAGSASPPRSSARARPRARVRAADRVRAAPTALGAAARRLAPGRAASRSRCCSRSRFCFGIAFPPPCACSRSAPSDAGAASARVYAWNTAGAIAGALSAPATSLLPALAFGGDAAAGRGDERRARVRARARSGEPGCARAVVAAAALRRSLRLALSEPRPGRCSRTLPVGSESDSAISPTTPSGAARRVLLVDAGPARWRLRSNGLPESLSSARTGFRRARPRDWLGALPVLLRPDTSDMLIGRARRRRDARGGAEHASTRST